MNDWETGAGAENVDTSAGMPGSGISWRLYCEGSLYGTPTPGGEPRFVHQPEYGPTRTVRYLAEQDVAGHVETYIECAGTAAVIEVQD
jgi:hypothetical protein